VQSAAAPEEPNFDPRILLRVLFRYKWLIAIVFVLVAGAVALYSMRQPKVYAAHISLIIDAREPRFLDNQIQDINSDSYSNYWANKEYVETQTRVITSRAVSQRVIDKLGLALDPSFLGLSPKIDPAKKQALLSQADAVAVLQSKIKVEPVKESRVTMIRIEDSDPTRAAQLANEVADAFVDENVSLKMKVVDKAKEWLDSKEKELASNTRESEVALYDFRKQSDMLAGSIDDRSNMVSAKLTSTSNALTDARLKIAALKARVSSIRSVQAKQGADDRLWAEALPAARENETLTEMKKRLIGQRAECSELDSRYLPEHPKLIECRDRLSKSEKEFERELSNLVLGTEAELKEALEKERNVNALLLLAKEEAFEVEKKKLELDALKSKTENNRRQFDVVSKRLKDIELSGSLRTSNVRILDAARPQLSPVRPNTAQSILFGMAAGLILGLALAFLLEYLDSSIKTQQDVEERLQIPFLGFLPEHSSSVLPEERDLHLFRDPKSPAAEFTRAVRTNVLFMSPDKPVKKMLVTSSGPREGKSSTVINLGVAMAQSGNRVLMIDSDMRRPRLHKAFGVPNDVGVSSLIVGESDIDTAVKSTEVPGLFILPCGPIPPNPAELLHTKAFGDLLEALCQRFDRILLDSPPVGAVADAVVLSTQCDGVMLVVRAGKIHRDIAKRTVRTLKSVNAPLFGAVLNGVNLTQSKYGEYYGFSYRYYGPSEQKET
jgi:polysaccharide biosynthesis transport protein